MEFYIKKDNQMTTISNPNHPETIVLGIIIVRLESKLYICSMP